jgi:hypothetical protein
VGRKVKVEFGVGRKVKVEFGVGRKVKWSLVWVGR